MKKQSVAKWIQKISMNITLNTVGKSIPAFFYEEKVTKELEDCILKVKKLNK